MRDTLAGMFYLAVLVGCVWAGSRIIYVHRTEFAAGFARLGNELFVEKNQ